ncbi:hypothetical protein PF005_g30320 [Phytophthora fragariae]|uniref:Pectate lyase n=1 Tax=Phytophthora fragariae TaxID=53985 RepID=A0A6A3DXQ8_9STRA|nr:hypothetical protein PF003_g13994 [Phytophthora fragariae]KAE8924727.1 hypothetical protein PF009_g25047 [Phytophthora fragariae]KAE8962713.1 hypothetical protein PF011_g29280 [Phytophthora fragariae]KAE9061800.1 hypothetical protein PF010_g29677 [Phytophthora fragariae]KAE9062154.1 hypothetical protein PF007_g30016 [Phytophthora fragariae]
MPSLRAIASSIFALTLVSSAQAGARAKTNVTDADSALLISAVSDVSSYSSGVSTYPCVYKVNSLETQTTSNGATDYNFGVTGCNAGGEEFVGRCPDLTSFAACGNYKIVVSSESKTSKPKVTSVKKQTSK